MEAYWRVQISFQTTTKRDGCDELRPFRVRCDLEREER
jgi:hypothetical protein